ncbi:hypothetical protein PAXRUDRAFT_32116 [Paxillus rubicundulus Ve08.2h10]|uniref:Uncharacterized protein n=1 Tax=Paxillus rubicundulus Ve08.2h10 TaxID=930991 RepID=A0A0D0DGA9_9AGAM|nr:hypothetical protein PAXRUDRAFT_32116 [Paxillus rubicundulus Ve08.2h10]
MAPKLHPQAQRLRTIIVSVPVMGATAYVLYERVVLGKPQRTIPAPHSTEASAGRQTLLGAGTEKGTRPNEA